MALLRLYGDTPQSPFLRKNVTAEDFKPTKFLGGLLDVPYDPSTSFKRSKDVYGPNLPTTETPTTTPTLEPEVETIEPTGGSVIKTASSLSTPYGNGIVNYMAGALKKMEESNNAYRSKIQDIKEKSKLSSNTITPETGFNRSEKAVMIGQGLGALFDAFDKSHEGQGSWKNEGADNLLNYVQNRLGSDKETRYAADVANRQNQLAVDSANAQMEQAALGQEMGLDENYNKTNYDAAKTRFGADADMARFNEQLQAMLLKDKNSSISGLPALYGNILEGETKADSIWSPSTWGSTPEERALKKQANLIKLLRAMGI